MTDIKLKERCPFCGNVGEIVAIGGNPVCGKRPYYTPQCQTYNCLLDKVEAWYDTPGEAAGACDRRVSPWRTDPPPKDGSEILGMFRNGPRVVFWDCWDDCEPHGVVCGWFYAGDSVMFGNDEPIKWMEVPK